MFIQDSQILENINDDKTNKLVCGIKIGEQFNSDINMLFRNRSELMTEIDKMVATLLESKMNVAGSFPVSKPIIGKNYVKNSKLYKCIGHYPLKKMVWGIRTGYLLMNDGTLYSCGYNPYGAALGNNTTTTVTYWQPFKGALSSGVKIVDVWAYNYELWLKGSDKYIYFVGRNSTGSAGLGNTTVYKVPTKVTFAFPSEVVDIKFCGGVDYTTTYYICKNGEIYACGNNGNGQYGNGTTTQSTTPTQIAPKFFKSPVVEMDSGSYATTGGNTIFRTQDGSIYVTGYNNVGQLGDGTVTTKNALVPITISLPSGSKITGVATGGGVSALVVNRNEIWVCGYGGTGCLNTGTTTNLSTFTKTMTWHSPIKKLKYYASVGGEAFGYCLLENGEIYSIGYNGNGQLGTRNTNSMSRWNQIQTISKALDFQISYRGVHILLNNYQIQFFGNNDQYQLGDGSNVTSYIGNRTIPFRFNPTVKASYSEPNEDFVQIL